MFVGILDMVVFVVDYSYSGVLGVEVMWCVFDVVFVCVDIDGVVVFGIGDDFVFVLVDWIVVDLCLGVNVGFWLVEIDICCMVMFGV